MNYRHHFHAGNFADVMKHALLVALARALQRKPGGVLFLDTHAGRGAYELSMAAGGAGAARSPEHPDGIGRLWTEEPPPEPLERYLRIVREFDGILQPESRAIPAPTGSPAGPPSHPAPRFYPGSPWILRLLARRQDRVALCEKHPGEFQALLDGPAPESPAVCGKARPSAAGTRRVSAREMDGYAALRALLPPPERRALILIDPPYEARDEASLIAGALREGLLRFPAGVYALWYPLAGRMRPDAFFASLLALALPPALALELVVEPESPGLRGCGLLVLNPPWRFEKEAGAILDALLPRLGRSPAASAAVRWLVPE